MQNLINEIQLLISDYAMNWDMFATFYIPVLSRYFN